MAKAKKKMSVKVNGRTRARGAQVGSERWLIERLNRGESLVLFDREASSVTGVFQRIPKGHFTAKNCHVVTRDDASKATVVKRVR